MKYGFTIPTALLLSACSGRPDFTQYRDSVKAELIDPDSAQFRNEKVRTLWTKGGKRRTVYCAEVNANNRFGGKTGFQYVKHFISTVPEDRFGKPGTTYIDADMRLNYYLDCVRADTQRSDENFNMTFLSGGEMTLDAESRLNEPIQSNDVAPELR